MGALQLRTGVEANNLGKYRLLAGLGQGGMATVHLAVVQGPSGFNKLAVIKQMHVHYAEDPEILGMFLDEARLAARLAHPNVVQTNEVGQEGDRHFLAMEYLDGQPLSRINHRLSHQGGLPLVMHLRVIADILAGLHYAHELTDYDGSPLGVVHRDVSPQNVFVTYAGVVKVVDFGIAKARDAVTQTKIGIIKGKIAYMAPEQARNAEVDRRADVFAVGVMLWEAVTGARPWRGVPELTILKRLVAGQFPSARSIKPEIPPGLEAILLKALATNPDDRYATAAELADALEAYLGTTGEHFQQRELGNLVSVQFETERAHIKAVIDVQLSAPPSAVARLPVIEDEITRSADAIEDPRSAGSTLPSEPILLIPKVRTSISAAFAATVRPTFLARPLSRRGLALSVGGLVVGAAMFAAMGFSLKNALTKGEGSAMAVTAIEPPALSKVKLRLSASPVNARFFLDDEPLEGDPWEGELVRDGAEHELRIEAPGYVTRIESVTLDTSRAIDIVLIAVGRPVTVTRPPFSPAPGSSIRPPHMKRRALDDSNPYSFE